MDDSLKAKAQDKASQSVDKIAQAISSNTERMSENCNILMGTSAICQNIGKYPILKSVNITEKDAIVKEAIDKISREGNLSASCLTDVRDLFCNIEYQKCSPEGTLLPICYSSSENLLKSCPNKSAEDFSFYPERLSNATNCFVGVKEEPVETPKASVTATSLGTPKEVSAESELQAQEPDSLNTGVLAKNSDLSEGQLEKIPEQDCTRYSYLAKWSDSTCFSFKAPNATKLPSTNEAHYTTGNLEFELAEGVKCKDNLELLKVQVKDSCACDTRVSVLRTCKFGLNFHGIHKDSKVISFRDVEYFPGLEKQLHFISKNGASESPLDDINDPHYFHRSYYRTCDRLVGVPDVYKDKSCSFHSQLDLPEPSTTSIKVYSDFKDSKSMFRSGCTIAECLNHLRYMPVHHLAKGSNETFNKPDDSDICKHQISNCPEWNFNSESISIEGYPANITSYLEMDIEAFPDTNRAAIIFSFRSLAQPVYEGLRFLINGVPAMDLVYNQTNYRAFAVPLVPGRSHVARWEFIRGEASAATGLNSVDIETIALRDASLASPLLTSQLLKDQHLQNNKAHIAPTAPTKPINLPQPVAASTTHASTTSSLIPMMVILLTGLGIGGLAMWLWSRHKNDKRRRGDRHVLGSYSAPIGFAERVAQFTFPSNHPTQPSGYAPLGLTSAPNLELDTMRHFESHLPIPDEDDEPSALDQSPTQISSTLSSPQNRSESLNGDELI